MSFSINLSTKNFADASKIVGNDEFHFCVGNKKVYCHKFVAAFLSHKLSQNFLSDPTICSFNFQIYPKSLENIINEDTQRKNEIEEKIIFTLKKLIQGETIKITEEELQQLNDIDISDLSKVNTLSTTTLYSILQIIGNLDNDELRQQLYERLFHFICKESDEPSTKETVESKLNKLKRIENFLLLFELFEGENGHTKKKMKTLFIEFKNIYNKIIMNLSMRYQNHFLLLTMKSSLK